MIVFYHSPPSRSSIVHWMLEEIGEPYELRPLDLKKNQQKDPAYLAVNPMGKVPAIDQDGTIVTEAAAICCHLADAFPQAGLAPPIGDPRRGIYLKWLFFGPSCLEPAIVDRMLKREPPMPMASGYGEFDTMLNVVAGAVAPGPYLLGEQFSAADVVIGAGLSWAMSMSLIPERPEIADYARRLGARAALQRVTARDQELAASMSG